MRILLVHNEGKPEAKTGNIHCTLLDINTIDVVLYDNYEFEIVSADKRRIKTIKLTIHAPIQEDEL